MSCATRTPRAASSAVNARIVAAISGSTREAAAALLDRSGGSVNAAILLAEGAKDATAANDIL